MMGDCTPRKTTCHPFLSQPIMAGNWYNYTETLGSNEYCEINIDASQFVGRVVVDDAMTVGATYSYNGGTDLEIGKVLDVN